MLGYGAGNVAAALALVRLHAKSARYRTLPRRHILEALLMVGNGLGLSWLTHWLFFAERDRPAAAQNYLAFPGFEEIVGCDLPKRALQEAIAFAAQPDSFQGFGVRQRRGILLHGPPGTGKTTLAKACARELRYHFFAINASEFCEIYVGMGPKKVRELFKKAKSHGPSIIFIDEIDAIGSRSRSSRSFDGAESERNSTINQLLSEMDGFGSSSTIMVIGATNNLRDVDVSLLRAGRFDLKIRVDLPDASDRFSMLRLHLSKKVRWEVGTDDLKLIADGLVGCSGADVESLANEAAYAAIRRKAQVIELTDLHSAIEDMNLSLQPSYRRPA